MAKQVTINTAISPSFVTELNTLAVYIGNTALCIFEHTGEKKMEQSIIVNADQIDSFEEKRAYYAAISQGFIEAADKLGKNLMREAVDMFFSEQTKAIYRSMDDVDLSTVEGLTEVFKDMNECSGNRLSMILYSCFIYRHLSVDVRRQLKTQLEDAFMSDSEEYEAIAATIAISGTDFFVDTETNFSAFSYRLFNHDSVDSESAIRVYERLVRTYNQVDKKPFEDKFLPVEFSDFKKIAEYYLEN